MRKWQPTPPEAGSKQTRKSQRKLAFFVVLIVGAGEPANTGKAGAIHCIACFAGVPA
jgi:hypothetical protein